MKTFFDGEEITFEQFKQLNPDFKGEVILYISGSQGVSPTDDIFQINDQNDFEALAMCFNSLIDENAYNNRDDYIDYDGDIDELEDEDEDEYCRILDEAQDEARSDSGVFYLQIGDRMAYTFDGSDFDSVNEHNN